MRAERQLDDDPDDDPPVAAPERVGVLRGTVAGPVRANTRRPQRRNRVLSTTTSIGASASSSLVTISRASARPSRSASQACAEKNRQHAWNDTTAAMPAPASMPTTVRLAAPRPSRWPAARTTRTSTTGETRDETSPTEHATKRVGSGPEASAELHLGVDNSDNRRCFVTLTTRSRRHAE